MPIPIAGAAIAGAIGLITGRLVKDTLDTRKKLEKNKTRNTGGVTTKSQTVNKIYRPSK